MAYAAHCQQEATLDRYRFYQELGVYSLCESSEMECAALQQNTIILIPLSVKTLK